MQQPDILGRSPVAPLSRSRFPDGFGAFRPDLGAFLKACRKKEKWKQQGLADAIGIARPSLSAIENGHAWPLLDTLEALARELELTQDMIFLRGDKDRKARSSGHSRRAYYRLELGRGLREGRKREGLTLRQIAHRCDISVAQLSRIERGDATRSRAYRDHPDYMELPKQDRPLQFRHPELQRLYLLDD